jgi:hypothetical protein
MRIPENDHIRSIAINLVDEIIAEMEAALLDGADEMEHADAQADALEAVGEHDPKTVARALLIAIADNLPPARIARR